MILRLVALLSILTGAALAKTPPASGDDLDCRHVHCRDIGISNARDPSLARRYLEGACTAGDGDSCALRALLDTTEFHPSGAIAESFLKKGCSLHSLHSCQLYFDGFGFKAKSAKTLEPAIAPWLAERCASDGDACFVLGEIHRIGWVRDIAKSVEVHSDNCERRNHPESCWVAARDEGQRTPSRPERIDSLLKHACAGGDRAACMDEARLAVLGAPPPQSDARALPSLACALGGCVLPDGRIVKRWFP